MIKRVLNLAAAIAAVAAAVAVCIVAAAYAVYAVATTWLTPAAAAAVVAGVFALVAVIVALVATRKVTPLSVRGAPPPQATPIDQVVALAKERPLIAAGVGAVAAFVLFRNPALVTAAVSAFMAGKADQSPKKK